MKYDNGNNKGKVIVLLTWNKVVHGNVHKIDSGRPVWGKVVYWVNHSIMRFIGHCCRCSVVEEKLLISENE